MPAKNAFSRGEPEHGGDLAEDLERIVALHYASTIAAVIVEPVAGSTGVLIPPKGYLKRIRDICRENDILYVGEIPQLLPTEMRTTIELVSSEDGGRTWTDPVAVSPTVRRSFSERDPGGAAGVFGTLRVVQGSQPVVAPDGTVHVAWLDSTDDESQKGVAEEGDGFIVTAIAEHRCDDGCGFVDALLAGDIYLNIHTALNPSGEVRGQVLLED